MPSTISLFSTCLYVTCFHITCIQVSIPLLRPEGPSNVASMKKLDAEIKVATASVVLLILDVFYNCIIQIYMCYIDIIFEDATFRY
jgi:hypothetical protein